MSIKKKVKSIKRWEFFTENAFWLMLILCGTPIIAFILFYGIIPMATHSLILQEVDKDPKVDVVINYSQLCLGITNTLLSILTIVLLGVTFFYTRKVNNKQLFEPKFFDLLKIHRENSQQINFENIHEEIYFISGLLKKEFPELSNRTRLDISYLAVFWGIGSSSEDLKRSLNKYHSTLLEKIDPIVLFLRTTYSNIHSHDSLPSPFRGRLQGIQADVGHYYRHLYQTVSFINKQSFLMFDEKYEYVKTLRAQFSNYELAVFFFNSISPLGRNWELGQEKFYYKLITPYAFIKNMPFSLVEGIEVKTIYPEIDYEND